MALAMVALGSNEFDQFGGARGVLDGALAAMAQAGVAPVAVSRFYRTPCFPQGNGPDFVNAVAQVATDLAPAEILQALHGVESSFGRIRSERWAQRSLDLDLLACGDSVLPDQFTVQNWIDLPAESQQKHAPAQLVLPHPRLQDRGFVLIPMADIAPDWMHPVLGKSVLEMLNALPDAEKNAIQPLGQG